ncbi:MAG: 50S ribosomal protein L18 [Epsilonproteobacteria bacterium]|nr:50S ribosomal protein L18 [Campylobacterota bacterium]
MRDKLLKQKNALRIKRKKRVRGKISGTATKPRVTIFKSNRYIYAQAIDDVNGTTLCAVNGKKLNQRANIDSAKEVGKVFAESLKKSGLQEVVFDRNGYQYNGVVVSFADALREHGIKL